VAEEVLSEERVSEPALGPLAQPAKESENPQIRVRVSFFVMDSAYVKEMLQASTDFLQVSSFWR
jgi:hypothetical protein